MSTEQVYCIGSVQEGFTSPTNHPYQDCSALIFWLPLIFRIRQLFQTADLSYTVPSHRATVYIMGIALGFVLRYCGRDFRLKKVCVRFGVICVVTVNIAVSSVVTAYGSMFWGYLHLYLHGRRVGHTFTYQTFAGLLFPFGFLTNIDSNRLFLLLLLFCFPHVSTICSEDVGSRSHSNVCIIVPNCILSHVRWL